MKNSRYILAMAIVIVPAMMAVAAGPVEPCIRIIYPEPEQRLGAVDSTFIFGNVPPLYNGWKYAVTINGLSVDVHDDGGFLAFVPIEPGQFAFRVEARLADVSYQRRIKSGPRPPSDQYPGYLADSVVVQVPEPWPVLTDDSLAILGDIYGPTGDVSLPPGSPLQFKCRATPGCRMWCSIEGIIDSLPMSETPPRYQPYWGEAVFGKGAVPDSLLVHGVYSAMTDLPTSVSVDTMPVVYHLAPPTIARVFARYFATNEPSPPGSFAGAWRLARTGTVATDTAGWRLSVGGSDFPRTVRFTDSVQIVRHGPRRGYLSTFQPAGVEAVAVGYEGDWYRLRLTPTVTGWVHQDAVEVQPVGIAPPGSLLRSIRTASDQSGVTVKLPLSGRHPFDVQEVTRRHLVLRLYGVTSDTDWIRHDFSDTLIDYATWRQPEPGLYQLDIHLRQDLWGYDTRYEGSTLALQIVRPPERVGRLKGKTVVVDPGHSRDPGARGPTGLTEAEANLAIALELRDRLEDRGANVVMTRDDMSHVELYDRPSIAKAAGADLFISVHNNALPDGVNPFANNGSSTYYYHLHSMDLARAVHPRLLRAAGLSDHGLYHGNLAVLRPTQYPAILVECSFMMIPNQEALLKTEKYQKRLAKGMVKGIEDFLKSYERRQKDG